jgi:hypothetical protein
MGKRNPVNDAEQLLNFAKKESLTMKRRKSTKIPDNFLVTVYYLVKTPK